ncbi:hypothetical protein GGS26DRAFT_591316 [Hypomontagnella submonticulosa]|nr:hypothetical protein GGS26DRAFT_591316 [Hypomontagnella submonticulosa]
MDTASSINAVRNGENPTTSGGAYATGASEDERTLRADRLNAFALSPMSTIVASDLDPEDISAAHEARIAAQLASILPHLPQV